MPACSIISFMNRTAHATLAATLLLGLSALNAQTPPVVATGLQAPQKLILTPGGNFLVTETSTNPNSGRLSFVSRSGTRRSLIEGLPSGTANVGDASGPSAMALGNRTLYLAIGSGDAERAGDRPGSAIFNPQGESSPIFSSVLMIQFGSEVDNLAGTFQFTPRIQQQLADGDEVTLDDGAGGSADIALLADFPDGVPDANRIYRFSNPWGLALSADGATLYVADASLDALVGVDTTTGRSRRLLRFPPSPNPTVVGPPVIDVVPTSVRLYGDQLLVSTLTGFPFLPQASRVYLVDPQKRTSSLFMHSLTSTTDLLVRPTSGPRPQFFTLEFSLKMTDDPPAPGRLLRFDTADATVMYDKLVAPVSMALDPDSNSLFVLQLTGEILEFQL